MDNKKLVKEIIDIFREADLAELEIEIPDFRLSLSKNSGGYSETAGINLSGGGCTAPPESISKDDNPISSHSGTHAKSNGDGNRQSAVQEMSCSVGETVKSPIVGTCFVAPGPDKPPFVKRGDVVEAGQPLCIIEAMKMMNEVSAPYRLKVVEINCENNTMVEFSEVLFEVEKC
ncbi:acetyl-CoA carboxylase biotin carboxyl carrier protein [Anaerovoracaceae bacterium SGI.195]